MARIPSRLPAQPTNWLQASKRLKDIVLEKRHKKAPGLSERLDKIEQLIKAIHK